jgi:F-type H+-transporting ATPase subunit epsilon
MRLEILTPEKKMFEGEVSSVKVPGVSGDFEMLNNHAPIVSALTKGMITIKQNNEITNISIEDGFIECLQNKVIILVGSGIKS